MTSSGTGLYLYSWGNNARRAALKGRACRVLAVGRLGSCLVEFVDDGRREIVSRRALRSAS
jgi:hypothetical protein